MLLKDSKTKKNLLKSFAGESQARNRYNIAASQAKKDGLYVIQSVFNYTANQEKEHAEVFYKQLKEFAGENIHIDGDYPIDNYESTLKLLKAANHNELEEYDVVYKSFSDVAMEEGFTVISKIFSNIASIEKIHADRFEKYAKELEEGTIYKKDESVQWFCTNCGYIYEGKEAPKVCPVCEHPQGYFTVFNEL
ncbi:MULTISPECIES: rubrerythrin [unclassified Clostridium]|uniref:rubrerythrin n=1 Tax=unclassified Clostridium TaxID=2614128 RepID=UPI000297FF9A|nr:MULTISPECIES: rubrerythrin family protein [unclassified Clostridium]EKQ56997.1 MAG: rubrerythrin [Clostridium sp. Maddingley MBC34-26]